MKNVKEAQRGTMRSVLLALFVLSMLAVTAFSLQVVYSGNIRVESVKGYAIYQNDVYRDTGDTMIPSIFTVQKYTLSVRNFENASRNVSISADYSGELRLVDPAAEQGASSLRWNFLLGPLEERNLTVLGKNLTLGEPSLSLNDIYSGGVSDRKLSLDADGRAEEQETFGYIVEEPRGVLDPLVSEERKLDIVAKSMLTLFAGLVVLTLASGFAFVFGSHEDYRSGRITRKARIHVGELYHNDIGSEEFSKYKYEESEFWK